MVVVDCCPVGGWSRGLAEWDGRLGGSHGGRERDLSVHMRGRRVVMVYRCPVGIVAQALGGVFVSV